MLLCQSSWVWNEVGSRGQSVLKTRNGVWLQIYFNLAIFETHFKHLSHYPNHLNLMKQNVLSYFGPLLDLIGTYLRLIKTNCQYNSAYRTQTYISVSFRANLTHNYYIRSRIWHRCVTLKPWNYLSDCSLFSLNSFIEKESSKSDSFLYMYLKTYFIQGFHIWTQRGSDWP